jgi:hypothetical protein
MPLEGEQGIVSYHAAAVIGDLNQFLAASRNLNRYSGSARVQGVLEKFFYHGGRPLDDFSGSDLVGNVLRKYVDAPHGKLSQFRRREAGKAKQSFFLLKFGGE